MKKRITAFALVVLMLCTAALLAGCKMTTTPKDLYISSTGLLKRAPAEIRQFAAGAEALNAGIALNELSVQGKDLLGGNRIALKAGLTADASGDGEIDAALEYAGEKINMHCFVEKGSGVYIRVDEIMDKYIYQETQLPKTGDSGKDKPGAKDVAALIDLICDELLNSLRSIDGEKFTKTDGSFEVNGVKTGSVTAVKLALDEKETEKLIRDYAKKIVGSEQFKRFADLFNALGNAANYSFNDPIIPLSVKTVEEEDGSEAGEGVGFDVDKVLDKIFESVSIALDSTLLVKNGECIGTLNNVRLNHVGTEGEYADFRVDYADADGKKAADAGISITESGADKPRELLTVKYYKDDKVINADLNANGSRGGQNVRMRLDFESTDGVYYSGDARVDASGEDGSKTAIKLTLGFSCGDGTVKFNTESLMFSQGMPITLPLIINGEFKYGKDGVSGSADFSVKMEGLVSASGELSFGSEPAEGYKAEKPTGVYTEEEAEELFSDSEKLIGRLEDNCPKIYAALSGMLGIEEPVPVAESRTYVAPAGGSFIIETEDEHTSYHIMLPASIAVSPDTMAITCGTFSDSFTFSNPGDGKSAFIGGAQYYSSDNPFSGSGANEKWYARVAGDDHFQIMHILDGNGDFAILTAMFERAPQRFTDLSGTETDGIYGWVLEVGKTARIGFKEQVLEDGTNGIKLYIWYGDAAEPEEYDLYEYREAELTELFSNDDARVEINVGSASFRMGFNAEIELSGDELKITRNDLTLQYGVRLDRTGENGVEYYKIGEDVFEYENGVDDAGDKYRDYYYEDENSVIEITIWEDYPTYIYIEGTAEPLGGGGYVFTAGNGIEFKVFIQEPEEDGGVYKLHFGFGAEDDVYTYMEEFDLITDTDV